MAFESGQSGNPAGRPRGVPDKRTMLRDLLTPHAADLVAKAVEMAMQGDVSAIRICLDRLMPPLKAADTPVLFGPTIGSLADQGRQVIAAIGDGTMTPDQAATVLQAIAAQARIVEISELVERVTALEKAQSEHGTRG